MQTQPIAAPGGSYVATVPLAEDVDLVAGVRSAFVQLKAYEFAGEQAPRNGVLRDTDGAVVGDFYVGIPRPWLSDEAGKAAAAVRAVEDAELFAGLAAVDGVSDAQRLNLAATIRERKTEALRLTGGDLGRVECAPEFFDALAAYAEAGEQAPGITPLVRWEPTA